MHRGIGLSLIAAALLVATSSASAQLRRTQAAGEPGAPAAGGAARPRIPASAASPFVGSWTGHQVVNGRTLPIGVDIELAGGKYSGGTFWPNDARAPHLNSRVVSNDLVWEQQNSGGGVWVYQAKRQAADSLVGTVALRGWPDDNGTPPSGTFVLVRMAAKD